MSLIATAAAGLEAVRRVEKFVISAMNAKWKMAVLDSKEM
ncbi:hypothetical protein SSU98_0405 [Streptococcus suis 98HAH33]|nr:hypothetical protein SSU98_0405 [Streptococcus suis 98HAH33]